MTEEKGIDRRGFHIRVIYGLWALMAAALSLPAALYLLWPPRGRSESEWTEAGDLSLLQPGVPEEVIFRHNRVDGWKVSSERTSAWVVKMAGGQVVAFAPQCTHLGCAYRWSDERKSFICPCHASHFAVDGHVLDGPAPRPLDRYQVKVSGNRLLLGPVRRSDA